MTAHAEDEEAGVEDDAQRGFTGVWRPNGVVHDASVPLRGWRKRVLDLRGRMAASQVVLPPAHSQARPGGGRVVVGAASQAWLGQLVGEEH